MNRETAHTYYWLHLGHREQSQWSTRFDGRSQWLSAVWSVYWSQVKVNDPLTKGLPSFEATFHSLVGWQGWGGGLAGAGGLLPEGLLYNIHDTEDLHDPLLHAPKALTNTCEEKEKKYTDRHLKPIYSGVLSKCRVTWGTLQELRVRLNLMSTSSRNNFGSDLQHISNALLVHFISIL